MAFDLMERARTRAEQERLQLASGERPTPRMKHAVQRTAAKALAVFFVLMLVLTLLSRAADGVTVARVETQAAKSGVLTQRITAGGVIEAQGDLEITLPAGIRVTRIAAAKGQQVKAGDTLLELDLEALQSAIEKLENDIDLLDLKIANAAGGNSGASTDAILSAQDALDTAQVNLKNAQEDYERLKEGRGTAEERIQEDLRQAQADCDEAAAALEKSKVKAKEELVKAAQEKADAAKEALETTKESARDAEDSAQQAVDSAQDQQSSNDSSYFAAVNTYNRAVEAVKQAQAELDELLANSPDDTAAIAAARSALLQAQSGQDQAEAGMNSLADAGSTIYKSLKRAKENLKSVQEKWTEKIQKAEREAAEAETKLAEAKEKTDMSEEPAVVSAQNALESAQRALQSAQRSAEDAGTSTEDQLLAARRTIESAQRGVESAQRGLENARRQAENERLTNQNTRAQAEIERLGYVSQRRESQKKLDELKAVAEAGGRLAAPIDGTVLSILEETGTTQDGAKAAVLSRSDQGFQFEGSIPQKEAETLAVGDEGTLSFTKDGKSQNVRGVRITSIGMADDKGMVKVTAVLGDGAWPTGGSAKLEISKRSETYNTCLPLGALRSDADGKFVLVLREKQTVMGTEQTVVKVPVEVLAQDSENMAVEASALGWDDQVVTSANKPISEGDRVRLVTAGK